MIPTADNPLLVTVISLGHHCGSPPKRQSKAETLAESGHRHLADVITGQLKGALAPNSGLSIVGERGEAVELLKNSQIAVGGLDILEATEVLIVLVKASHDHLDGVVGLGNDVEE